MRSFLVRFCEAMRGVREQQVDFFEIRVTFKCLQGHQLAFFSFFAVSEDLAGILERFDSNLDQVTTQAISLK